MALAPQRSLDDPGTPLHDVTFCVVDLETTGGSPRDCLITEIGAVRLRGGHCLGTFQTLVNPGRAIPPSLTVLTGITQSMVVPAPRIEEVLPALLEFIGGGVVVGHNVRFDLAFLAAACERAGYPAPANTAVDTCTLARRLVLDDVADCRLGTLASRFGLPHRPSHRALDDALATGDLLHVLLERVGTLGVTGLDDLLSLPRIDGPQVAKLKLTVGLPRSPGVYLFRDAAGRVLHVGRASNLRAQVRAYFSGAARRDMPALLREVRHIDHEVCTSPLEAAVREVRLLHQSQPPHNRQGGSWARYAYVRLPLDEPFPRLTVVRDPRPDSALYLGPLPSRAVARQVVDAVETVIPLRRCAARLRSGTPARAARCRPSPRGVASCPCTRATTAAAYGHHVRRAVRGLTADPDVLLAPLRARMELLAAAERFEEAAEVRDRAQALADAVGRQRHLDMLRRAGRLVLEVDGGPGAAIEGGRLVSVWPGARGSTGGRCEVATEAARPSPWTSDDATLSAGDPCPRPIADEVLCVARWLDAEAGRVRILHCEGSLSSPLPALASFEPPGAVGRWDRGAGGSVSCR
jgi:DNA polymerase III subunit epsilon